MNNIYNYLEFINEATIGYDKVGLNYQLSRPGREIAFKFSTSTDLETFNIKFEQTNQIPNNKEKVLLIRSSSFLVIDYIDLKSMYNLEDKDLMIYKLISDDIDIKWGVAKIGQKTTVIKQLDRTGSSKRGDYFRETAFLIRFAKNVWEHKGVKLNIFSNRGKIEMNYLSDGDYRYSNMSKENSDEFIKSYVDFENNTDDDILSVMDEHCFLLMDYLGESINKIEYIIKNNSKNLINVIALEFMRQESIQKNQLAIDTNFDFDIPPNSNVSKWNPSDIWIVFDGKYFSNKNYYSANGINNIWDLNYFLYDSLRDRNGLVGVSLKMSKKNPEIYPVTGDKTIVNRFTDFNISNKKKTAEIEFEYLKKGETGEKWEPGSGIDCRTFNTDDSSSISLEVKGKKDGGYVSGKAGSIINYLLPEYYLNIKNTIRLTKSKEELRKSLGIDFDKIGNGEINKDKTYLPSNEKLRKVFLEDLKGDEPKNSNENSRLQSVVFFDWLLSLDKQKRNEVITTVVRYAKSESLWSAPHIVLK